ncbi:MAG: hypothetical protein IIY86_04300, partial [Lachnospiraceae bacterium]|nr:hypothetical protein [Lachnospiraceae bacterium]
CVIADDFENDVIAVHKFLFGQGTEYAGSDVIRSIAAKILDYKGRGVESDTYDNSYDDTYAAPTPRQQYNNNNNDTTQDTGEDNTGGGAEQDTGGGGQDSGGGADGGNSSNSGEIIQ